MRDDLNPYNFSGIEACIKKNISLIAQYICRHSQGSLSSPWLGVITIKEFTGAVWVAAIKKKFYREFHSTLTNLDSQTDVDGFGETTLRGTDIDLNLDED